MWDLFDSHQILVFPTIYDSFPLVVLEASRIGLPVIATPVYAIPEILNHDSGILLSQHPRTPSPFGYLLPVENMEEEPDATLVKELRQAMRRLIDPQGRLEKSLKALHSSEKTFGVDVLNKKWYSMYQALLANQKKK
jgi:glycosyltransferase involved in cell wall biosynthesis